MRFRSSCHFTLALTLAFVRNSTAAEFFVLEDLPVSGMTSTNVATGVSSEGSVVVGTSNGKAFRWTRASGVVPIGDLESRTFEHALAVSDDGTVVVGQLRDRGDREEAFRWTVDGGIERLGDLPPDDETFSAAQGTSGDGSVVVGEANDDSHTFVWTREDGMKPLPSFTGDHSGDAKAISADGTIIVGSSSRVAQDGDDVLEAVRWTRREHTVDLFGLGDIPGGSFHSFATGVSSDGTVVVGSGTSPHGSEAFRWTSDSGLVGLGVLDERSPRSLAQGVSGHGTIVVGSSSVPAGEFLEPRAFIWDEWNGMRDLKEVLSSDFGLDLTGWSLEWAEDISADGRTIVGGGVDPSGRGKSWVAVIPEPSSLATAICGISFLLLWYNRATRIVDANLS